MFSCLVPLFYQKPAFASHSGTSAGDLGSFFRECQAAPPLSLFRDNELLTLDNVMVRHIR